MAVVSCLVPEPQFEGQTKTKLGNGEIKGIVASVVNEKLAEFLRGEPQSRQQDHLEGRRRGTGAGRGAQGPRPHAQKRGT